MLTRTSVVVVGGSLTGLTSALLLSQLGIGCLVVERHPSTTVQYKFRGISPRSMEVFRSAGVEDAILLRHLGDQKSGQLARGRNLSDPEIRLMGPAWPDTSCLSAVSAETCDQDRLEPILRSQAERLGADIRFGTELLSFTQDHQGVVARIQNVATGEVEEVEADYLIAADGFDSGVRRKLGVSRHGPGILQHWMNLIFETDLEPFLNGQHFTASFVTDINGSIVPREDRWMLAVQYEPEKGEKPDDFNQARTADLVRRAAGREDIGIRLFDARDWTAAAYVAERFQAGRVFLVGDSAHSMPPTGGFGGNTGIHDAHNLAWKLAFVLKGWGGEGLLESYDPERRHIAERTLGQALARLGAWFEDPSHRLPPAEPILDDLYVIFGQTYPRGAFVADGRPQPPQGFEDPRAPSARPGTRAPHIVIDRNGMQVPIHDLFHQRLVLLTKSPIWKGSASLVERHFQGLQAIRLDVGPQALERGADAVDVFDRFERLYRVSADGAVLIRPDGVIAWTTAQMSEDPDSELKAVIAQILSDHRPF